MNTTKSRARIILYQMFKPPLPFTVPRFLFTFISCRSTKDDLQLSGAIGGLPLRILTKNLQTELLAN